MGSASGVAKQAAGRTGTTVEDYEAKRQAGLKWCTSCKEWHERSAFPVDRSRGDGLKAHCLASDRGKPRGKRDPMRELARGVVNRSVLAGRLPAANTLPCSDCGHVITPESPRRHEYDHFLGYEPEHQLDVQAVCTLCHADREKGRRV